MDLGVEGPSLSLCTATETMQVLGLHAEGHGPDILKCVGLTDKLAKECQAFFPHTVSFLEYEQDWICKRNLRFRYHSWEERYPDMYKSCWYAAGRNNYSEIGWYIRRCAYLSIVISRMLSLVCLLSLLFPFIHFLDHGNYSILWRGLLLQCRNI